jgi:hypothetical protein
MDTFVWVGLVGLVVVAFAAGSQGRGRHLMLMLFGAVPRRNPREILTDVVVPRGERDWSLVQQVGVAVAEADTAAAKTVAPEPAPLVTAGPTDSAPHRARKVRTSAAA